MALRESNEHLDNAVEALRQVVFADAMKAEHKKIFTTGQIYEILRRQYYAQKREYQKSLERTAQPKKKVISQNRALSMAEDLYLKRARKKSAQRCDGSKSRKCHHRRNRRRLLFFLPFYIFCHEKELPEYESDEAKLKKLTDEYRHIRTKLDELQKAGDLSAFMKNAICAMITHVLSLIAENYNKVREGVEHIMGGKVIEYEAKTIRNEERQRALAETEERAKDMIRDRMDLPLVEKYTHLSMPRIQELARDLGML